MCDASEGQRHVRVDAAAAANTSAFEKMYLYFLRKSKGIFIPVAQAPKHIEAPSKEPSVIGDDAGVRVPPSQPALH